MSCCVSMIPHRDGNLKLSSTSNTQSQVYWHLPIPIIPLSERQKQDNWKLEFRGWRDDSLVVEKFHSQHSHDNFQPPVAPVSGTPKSSFDLRGTVCMWYREETYMQTKHPKKLKQNKNSQRGHRLGFQYPSNVLTTMWTSSSGGNLNISSGLHRHHINMVHTHKHGAHTYTQTQA